MKCPVCGSAELVHDVRDIPYTYKGKTTFIPQVEADFCPVCGESLSAPDKSRRMMGLIGGFHKQINREITNQTENSLKTKF